MPGSVLPITGFIYRDKGKGVSESSSLQRFGKGGAMFGGGGNIATFANQAGMGNGADTTEDLLFTLTLPANCLDVIGRQLLLEAYGQIAATSASKNARMYFGGTTLMNFAATTTQTGVWYINALITKTGASHQTALILTDTSISGSNVRNATILSPNEVDTAPIICRVTGQSSVGTAALVTCNNFTVSGYN